MDREKDLERKKKKKKQEEAYNKSKVMRAPVARKAPPVYRPPPRRIPPPMPVPRMPTNYNLNKQKMEMMRRQIRSDNQIRDAQAMKRMLIEKNNEILRQRQGQSGQRQMSNARIAQTNEHNIRVSGGARRP